jgi:F0F1-type ATP synthase assembly protein I
MIGMGEDLLARGRSSGSTDRARPVERGTACYGPASDWPGERCVTDDEPTRASDNLSTKGQDYRPAPSMDDSAWGMFGYVLSGILFWGGIGWLLDRWLEFTTPVFVPIGVLAGAALGVYLGYMKFLRS